MRIYISGPISSKVPGATREQLKERFHIAEELLVERNHTVVNPLFVGACLKQDCGVDDGHTWECWLKHDIMAMLSCQAIYLLPDWHLSKGAMLELYVATQTGMEVLGG